MIDKVREQVMGLASEQDWNQHIKVVVYYAVKLARHEKADVEVAELGALLHDIGRIKYGSKDHEITGLSDAENLLKQTGYSSEIVDKVKHCIRSHRASKDNEAESLEAEIVRDADALAHFDAVFTLFRAGVEKRGGTKQSLEWLDAKLDRDFKNKMHLAESRRLAEDKYKAAKLLIGANLAMCG